MTPGTDPQLNAMLWDEVKNSLANEVKKWENIEREAAQNIGEHLKNMFVSFLAKYPSVESLAFSLTNAEYDDEGYGGFNFTEVRPRFYEDNNLSQDAKAWIAANEDEYCANYVEPSGYSYRLRGSSLPDDLSEIYAACVDINNMLFSVRNLAQNFWHEGGVKVERDKISFFDYAEELK